MEDFLSELILVLKIRINSQGLQNKARTDAMDI